MPAKRGKGAKRSRTTQPFDERQLRDIGQRVAAAGGSSSLTAVHATSYAISNASLAVGASVSSGDIRGVNGVPAEAAGVFLVVRGSTGGTSDYLALSTFGQTPDDFSPRVTLYSEFIGSAVAMIGLAADGKFTIKNIGASSATGIYVSVVGYWT